MRAGKSLVNNIQYVQIRGWCLLTDRTTRNFTALF